MSDEIRFVILMLFQGTVAMPDKRVRLRRLMKELSEIQRTQNRLESTFTAELVNDNLFEWHVRLHKIDPESELAADMRELDIPYILLHVVFPENFPFAPPFMRVISPRIEKGFVMEGGAICMELLTPRGWASAYTIEAVITQFAASIVKGQVKHPFRPSSRSFADSKVSKRSDTLRRCTLDRICFYYKGTYSSATVFSNRRNTVEIWS